MRLLQSLIVVGIVVVGWWGYGQLQPQSVGPTVDTYRVERRSFPVTLKEKGELEAAESIDVKSQVEGRSTIIWLIPEGTHVAAGDKLVELASDQIEERLREQEIQVNTAQASLRSSETQFELIKDENISKIEKAELKLELAELELHRYNDGEWPQRLQDADLRVKEARQVWERAADESRRSNELAEKNFITETERKTDEFNAYKADIEYKKAIRDYEILQQFTHVAELKQRQSDVEEAGKELDRVRREATARETEQAELLKSRRDEFELRQSRLQKTKAQLALTEIRAPSSGLVVYGGGGGGHRFWDNDQQVKEGAEVIERQTIMQLPNTDRMKVTFRVHEAQVGKIRVGLPATVLVEGQRDKQYTGKISNIGVLADSGNRWLNPDLKEYETEVTLDQTNLPLKPGSTAHVEILIQELDDALAVPIQSVYRRGPRSFVFVRDRGVETPIEVETGLANDEFVEIRQGLQTGTEILLAVSDDQRRELPRDAAANGRPGGEAPEATAQAEPTGESKSTGERAQPAGERGPRGKRPKTAAPPSGGVAQPTSHGAGQ